MGGWWPPCPCQPLPSRSWAWGRPGCYEGVYWPLSQLRSTWNNLKDYNLLNWEARFPWTNGPSGWPSGRPGCFWLCFGRPGHKIHCPCEAKSPFCDNFELGGQIFSDQWYFMLAFTSHEWFWLCFGWPGHKIYCLCEAKRNFCVNFWQKGHLPTQYPGFGSKLSSKGTPGTCALLETLQSPVEFFLRAKLLGLLHKFCILPTYFCKYWWFVYIRQNQRWTAFQKCLKTFLWLAVASISWS